MDYTSLNKACPKDSYPLPKIDQLVDSTAGHHLLSFLDAYSKYHQIPMHPEDEEKIAFITDYGLFYYTRMPFGLKNAGVIDQRLVNKVFADRIGKNIEVYVDDMLVKSVWAENHITDLSKTFGSLRKFGMKLNPAKCAFGVSAGKFLDFMVSQRGIEANPEKVQDIIGLSAPTTVKEVKRLNRMITALGRFM